MWVSTLREPPRGGGAVSPGSTVAAVSPWRTFGAELTCVLPPLTIVSLARAGVGMGGVALNLAAAVGCALAAWAMTAWLGSPAQWGALGIGVYAAISWAQGLARRDPEAFAAIFRTPTLRPAAVGFSLLAFTGYGQGFWLVPYFIRVHGVGEAEAGLVLGGSAAAAGWLGVTLGGWWADRWRRTTRAARLYVGVCTGLIPLPIAVALLATDHTWLAYFLNVPLGVCISMWIGPGASTVQDLVPPRVRATAAAAYLLVVTFIGLALGPYTIGRLSFALGDLRQAMLLVLVVNFLAVVLLLSAARRLPADEARLGTMHYA
jgi:hypothetical protein